MNCSICGHPNRPTARFCANCRAPLILQNKYRIARLLGRGGYGAVYQAEHTGLGGALYAIKELYPDPTATPEQQQAASDQFRLEASILAKLNHATLPKVMDFFSEGNRDYLVMEYVEGETLEEQLTRNRAPLPEAQVLVWAQELCDVLTYLHTRQPNPVIHRDVKPSNIKITPDGKLKLIDFGIAKLLVAGVGTKGAARAVSPPYSPMEQYGKGTDARSDIYALGVTLYELLTNRLPPEAPDRASEPVISPLVVNPALTPHATALVLKAMAEKPAERFQSAAEMKQALTAPTYQQSAPAQQPAPYAPSMPAYAPTPRATAATSGFSGWAWLAIVLVVGGALLFGVQEISRQQAIQATATSEAATAIAMTRATQTAEARASATAQATSTAQARATATAQAQAMATAQARATATAGAQATATRIAQAIEIAKANATATAQAAQATAIALARSATRVYGPNDGRLYHVEDGYVETRAANVDVLNVIAEARFFNPFSTTEGTWDYGFMFRHTDSNQEYRLIVSSSTSWRMLLVDGDPDNSDTIDFGDLDNLDISANGSNHLRLVAKGATLFFFVNGRYIATLDISGKTDRGDVHVGTGFYNDDEINGKTTRYEGFTVWSLP